MKEDSLEDIGDAVENESININEESKNQNIDESNDFIIHRMDKNYIRRGFESSSKKG